MLRIPSLDLDVGSVRSDVYHDAPEFQAHCEKREILSSCY